jgi:hypothetical protein
MNPNVVCAVADKLWKELLGGEQLAKKPLNISHLGLTFQGVESIAVGQRHISGFFQVSPPTPERPNSAQKRKRSESAVSDIAALPEDESGASTSNVGAWKCPKCKTRIIVDFDPASSSVDGDLVHDDAAERLAKLRMIHEDGHFAESLARSLNGTSQLPSPSTPTIKSPLGRQATGSKERKPVKKKKKEGLLLFFEPKS